MIRHILRLLFGAALVAAPVTAQTALVFSSLLSHHWPHLATKPLVTGLVYWGARDVLHTSPAVATVAAVTLPLAGSIVYAEHYYPGSWRQPAKQRDYVADVWAGALAPLLIRTRGLHRWLAVAVWGTVEFGVVHRWSMP